MRDERIMEVWGNKVRDAGIRCGDGGMQWGWRNTVSDERYSFGWGDAVRDGGIQCGIEKYSERCRNLVWEGGVQ
jgi:hypothetical protein